MGGSRLPNKMMLWLHGLPIIAWVLFRVKQAKLVDQLVFAIPNTPENDVLQNYLETHRAIVFRGSENDVLSRYYDVATAFEASIVVRICADNPLIMASELDRLIELFRRNEWDYAYNHVPKNNRYPNGLGAEVTRYHVLELIHREARLPGEREHVFDYLWNNPKRFKIGTFNPEHDCLGHPELRLDLDTFEDYSNLLSLNVRPDSTAEEIISAALNKHKE